MPFWSSQTLDGKAGELIKSERPAKTDCNAFLLRVGEEIFVTPTIDEQFTATKRRLVHSGSFVIPPQQFAIILTEEIVHVPNDAMAFISMRATFKLQGLINVSGFHVDPGWEGPLIFAVYNAGPSPIHLSRGLELFLIWYADLDAPSQDHKTRPGAAEIETHRITHLTPAGDSLYALNRRLLGEVKDREASEKALIDRIHRVENRLSAMNVIAGILSTAVVGTLLYLFRTEFAMFLKATSS